jgi:type IV pilus assembly protein PilC
VQRLSISEKREFYAGMARLMRSGTSLPAALELMAQDAPRRVAHFLRALNTRIKAGEPLGDALLMQRPRVSELEASIVSAAARGGRLDRGCEQLARYFEALERAGKELTSRMMYPVLVLIGGPFILNIKFLFTGSLKAFLWAAVAPLVIIFAIAAGIWLGWKVLAEVARTNVLVDALLARIPGIGPVRERFALARFFATLDAQLEAGVNIWEAFANAARTSDSARIITAARRAMPMLQAGERLSEALSREKVLPLEYLRAFRVAEQTGELDSELTALAEKAEKLAVATLNRWSEWLPRLIYGMVVVYSGYQIVSIMRGYVSQINSVDPFNN